MYYDISYNFEFSPPEAPTIYTFPSNKIQKLKIKAFLLFQKMMTQKLITRINYILFISIIMIKY